MKAVTAMTIKRKDAQRAIQGMTGFRKELEKERNRLRGSVRMLKKHAKRGTLPEWGPDAFHLFRSPDYSFGRMLKLLRKHKVL